MIALTPPARRRASTVSVAVALAAVIGGAAPAGAVPSNWTNPTKAWGSPGGPAHDVAVETGTVFTHIASQGGPPGIWHIAGTGSSWTRTRLTSTDDRTPSIAIDGTSIVVIAFTRKTAGQQGIYTATNANGGWDITKRHSGNDGPPSLAVRDGVAHIAFQAPNGLRYLRGAYDAGNEGWVNESVDGTCCSGPPALDLTADGKPRIAYPDGSSASPTGLAQSSRGSGGWSRMTVATYRVKSVAFDVDTGGSSHIAFVRPGGGTWYATRSTAAWGFRQLDPSLSGPPDLSSHSGSTAFVFGKTGKIRYATLSGGIIWAQDFTTTKGDRKPHIVRNGGKPVVTFARANGGSTDGVLFTREK
jgi:hypothetical protein